MFRLVLVVAVTVAMARLGYAYFEDVGADPVSMHGLEMAGQRIDAEMHRMEQFRKLLDQTLAELAEEDLTLTQAIDRLEEAANSYNPVYLKMLTVPKRAASTRERIAHNLFRHFVAQMEDARGDTMHLNKVLCRLRLQLATMFPPAPTESAALED